MRVAPPGLRQNYAVKVAATLAGGKRKICIRCIQIRRMKDFKERKRAACCSRPFPESSRLGNYQANLTIIWNMRWPIVFVAVPKLGFASVPLLLNVRFKFWSPLRNVRFGWLRKLYPEKRN